MKKLMKKLLAVVAAMTMVMGLAVTANAATGDGTNLGDITVEGAIKGATYSAVKVFNATYDENAKSVSYTIPDGSLIESAPGFSDVFATSTNGDKTYVTIKEGKTAVDILSFFNSIGANAFANNFGAEVKAVVTNTEGKSSIVLPTGEAGYYFIYSELGDQLATTIDTAQPTATVKSKIETTPDVPTDGKKINGRTVNTMEVGDTGNFTLTFNATNYAVTAATSTAASTQTLITSYTVTDTLDGFTITDAQLAALKVTVGGTEITRNDNVTSESDTATAATYAVSYSNNVLTVTIHNWDKGSFTSPSEVVVSYSANLTNAHVVGESTNKFTVKYNNTTIPNTPETKTYNYKVVINKYAKGDSTKKLSGAKFVLAKDVTTGEGDSATTTTYYYVVNATTGAVTWTTTQADATVVTTDANGAANFQGLEAGTYKLIETEAPAGYNLLTTPTTVTLNDITTALTATDDNTIESQLTNTSNVENSTGAELPSTGGMGTTIFYVLGAALVIGAGVVLVTRRRLSR